MKGEFQTTTTRHEAKMKPIGESPHPGDERDRRLPLSYAGMQNASETGENQKVIPKDCDLVIIDHSNLVRTTLTAMYMLAGAGYDPDESARTISEVIWNPEDERIGLANGMDFDHPAMPKYSPVNPGADNYVAGLLKNCWLPVAGDDENRPVAAKLVHALLGNKVKAIEFGLGEVKRGAHVLHLQATHAPYIDTLDAALFGTVQVYDGEADFDQENWPGHYAMGTFVTGRMIEGGTEDNPQFVFQGIADRAGEDRVTCYSLDCLKGVMETLERLL
jgi:hypothetical protein